MAGLRAPKAGSARDAQNKVDSNFDVEDARRCLDWISEITGVQINFEATNDNKFKMMEFFYKTLKDGLLLCRLINCIVPDDISINFSTPTFKVSKNEAFNSAKERERLEIFVYKAQEFGVPENMTFQIDNLYEKTNLVQVCACIRCLGIEAESRPSFTAKHWWPRKSEANRRTFTEEQLRAGESVINLQYGTNKMANQSGMNFGKKRMITKD